MRSIKSPETEELYEELVDGAVRFDNLDKAIIGTGSQYPSGSVFVYDGNKIIDIFVKDYGMSLDEAEEWCGRNVFCFGYGEGTPIIFWEADE